MKLKHKFPETIKKTEPQTQIETTSCLKNSKVMFKQDNITGKKKTCKLNKCTYNWLLETQNLCLLQRHLVQSDAKDATKKN